MSGLLSKGISLNLKVAEIATPLLDLQSIPDLGGDVDQVETTTLNDASKKYIDGLLDYGALEFEFLFANTVDSSYRKLKGLETEKTVGDFEIAFPDGTKFTFSATVTTKIGGVGVGDVLLFTASLTPTTEMEIVNPEA